MNSAGRGLLRFIVVLIEDGSYSAAGSEYATSKAELAIDSFVAKV